MCSAARATTCTLTLAFLAFLAAMLSLPFRGVAETGAGGSVAGQWGLYGTLGSRLRTTVEPRKPFSHLFSRPEGNGSRGGLRWRTVMNDLWRDKDAARRQIFTGVRAGTDGMIELHTIIGDEIVALEKHQKDARGRMRVFYSIDLRSGLGWIENALVIRQGPELDRSPELFLWLTRCPPATT